jgi:hypothetical protein
LKGNFAAGLHRVIAMAAGSGDPEALHVADALAIWLEGNDSVRLEDALGVASTWRSTMRRWNGLAWRTTQRFPDRSPREVHVIHSEISQVFRRPYEHEENDFEHDEIFEGSG